MQTANRIHIAIGLVTAALGTMPFLAATGILPTRPHAPGDAPNWVAFAIGLAFVLAGIMVIVRSFAGAADSSGELPDTSPRPLRAFYDLLVMPIPVLIALIFSWVAFGPGERHFTMSVGAGGAGAATAVGGQTLGRIMFGAGAVLGWIVAGFMVRTIVRRWRAPRP